MASVMGVAAGLLVAGLVAGAFAGLISLSRRQGSRLRAIAAALGMGGSLADFAAAAYVMSQLPGAAEQDLRPLSSFVPLTGFWGAGSGGALDFYVKLSWGAGWGWYAAIVSAALLLIAGVLQWRVRAGPRTAPRS